MKRALLYSVIALALLYVVRELEYEGLRRNKHGEFAKLREAFLEKHDCDLLLIGSSRTECQFFPPVIFESTHLRSFNIGMMGATMPFIRTSLEAYLVHSAPPKYVVLNLDLHSLGDKPDSLYLFPRYFAYLSNEKLYDGIKTYDKRFFYFRHLPFYSMPYYGTHYLNASFRGWMDKPGKYDKDYYDGFAACTPKEEDLDSIFIPTYYQMSPQQYVMDNLDSIRTICRRNGSELILVFSPIYHRWEEHVTNYRDIKKQFAEYASAYNLKLFDLSEDPIRSKKQYYADAAHLNMQGALLFSLQFSAELRQYLEQ